MFITLGKFIDNMEKNGFPQIRGSMFSHPDGNYEKFDVLQGACALGQAFFNTTHDYRIMTDTEDGGFEWKQFYDIGIIENTEEFGETTSSFDSWVVYHNDTLKWTIQQIVDEARKVFKEYLNYILEIPDAKES